ncbi:hypothetical protein [Subtercola boreus]|uniref:hypothetical protein n=1 Tax=Subtercola boreus TaxID=120213 RepID=UPI0011520660|nr:hypothetical protein [Subtercola boreus]
MPAPTTGTGARRARRGANREPRRHCVDYRAVALVSGPVEDRREGGTQSHKLIELLVDVGLAPKERPKPSRLEIYEERSIGIARLHEEGMNDADIAGALELPVSSVWKIRVRLGLAPNASRGRPKTK